MTAFLPRASGRFRFAHIDHGLPTTTDTWRLTTADAVVADTIHRRFGGVVPREYPTGGPDSIEVLTAAAGLDITITGRNAYRRRYIDLDDPAYLSDGEVLFLSDGTTTPDPEAHLGATERRRAATGTRRRLHTSLAFRLDDLTHLGDFVFSSISWDLAERFYRTGIHQRLATGRPVTASLVLTRNPSGARVALPNATAHLSF